MALDPGLSKAVGKAAVDAIVDTLDTGTGANARLRIYNGTQPASPDATIGGATLLAEIDLGAGAVFGAATTGTAGDANYIIANMASAHSDASANASGTASWFRAVNKGTVAKIDGSVGTATADLILDSVSITAGQSVTVSTWKVRLQFKN